MAYNSNLDGSEKIVVISKSFLDELGSVSKDAAKRVGPTRVYENNEAYIFTPVEFSDFCVDNFLTVNKFTKSKKPNISWGWVRKTVNLPERVIRHFIPGKEESKQNYVRLHPSTSKFCGNHSHESFRIILENTIGKVLKRNIELDIPHDKVHKYIKDSLFRVFVWSAPKEVTSKEVETPERIWDIEISCDDHSIVPSTRTNILKYFFSEKTKAEEEMIYITDGKYKVATVLPNAIYIHHDVTHFGNENEMEIFALIMRKASEVLSSKKEWKKIQEKFDEEEKIREQKIFEDTIDAALKFRNDRNKFTLKSAKEEVKKAKQVYFDAEKRVFVLENSKMNKSAREKFIDEFMKLKNGKVDGVLGVSLDLENPNTIIFHFDDVIIPDPKNNGFGYHLGKCDCTVSFGEYVDVSLVNVTYGAKTDERHGYIFHSPHAMEDVDEDSEFASLCLGNIETELNSYMAHFELEASATLLYAFLQSVNDDESVLDHGYIYRMKRYPKVKLPKVS